MSGNVSNSGQKLYITLQNGHKVNLNALDKLVGQQTSKSIFAGFEKKIGDGDGTYSQKEIDQIKNELYQMYINDQKLAQEELDEVFGKNQDGSSNVSISNINSEISKLDSSKEENDNPDKQIKKTDSTSENETPSALTNTGDNNYTDYVVQPGDTPEKIAAKLGLKGQEAKDYAAELTQRLKANGQMKKWLSVGDKIQLAGNHSETIAQMKDYSTDKTVLKQRYDAQVAARQPKLQGIEAEVPSNIRKIKNDYKKKGIDFEYVKNQDGTFSLVGTKGASSPNITRIEKKFDKNGNLTSQIQNYKNGSKNTKIVFKYDSKGNKTSQTENRANGDQYIFEYDSKGKKIKETHKYLNGKVVVGKPDASGKFVFRETQKAYPTSIQNQVKQIFNAGNNVSVVKNKDGSYTITEKRDAWSKDGITKKEYKYNASGKKVKTTTFYTPQKMRERQAKKEAEKNNSPSFRMDWSDFGNRTHDWYSHTKDKQTPTQINQPQPKQTPVKTNSPKTSKQPATTKKAEVLTSEASKIPGFERIKNSTFIPKDPAERAKYLIPSELQYPEAMRNCIIDLRASGVGCQIKKDRKGNYVVELDDKKRTFIRTADTNGVIPGKTTVTFDNAGKIISSEENQGLFITKTTFTNGVPGKAQIELPKPEEKINPKTHIPYSVEDKLAELKKQAGNNVQLIKSDDGTFVIERTDVKSESLKNQNYKKITYKYDSEGNFKYQINFKAEDESSYIGTINPSTKQLEFRQFRDSKGLLVKIPDNVLQKRMEMLQDGGQAGKIIKGSDTFTIEQTKGQYLEANGLSKIVHKYDAFGKLISQDYTYKNGRTVNYYDASKKGGDAAHIANPITIQLPAQYKGKDSDSNQMIYGLETKGPKDTAQRYARSIEKNKANLMKTLALTNEEYDNLAILAMGIAEQETHFGQPEYKDTKGDSHTQNGLTDRAERKYYVNKFVWSNETRASHSQGITQINYNNALKDPVIAQRFKQYGINSFEELDASPEKQAIATMIILKQNKNTAESSTWQERLKQNNAKISNPNDRLTTNDVIALLWNGAGGVVKRMNAGETITINTEKKEVNGKTLNGAFYAKAVRAYASKFFATPATAGSGSMHTTTHANVAGAVGAQAQNNGGGLGEVVFMPDSYSNKWRVASGQTKQDLKNLVNENQQLSTASRTMLQGYIDNGYIGFGNKGLTKEEAMTITDADVRLMKTHIDKILHQEVNANQANADFEKAYLQEHQFTVATSTISKSSVLGRLRSANPENSRLPEDYNFSINDAFYTGGAKRHSARYVSESDQAYNGFAVTKSKGVNPYLANGKTSPKRDRVLAQHAEYTATELMESGGRCKTGIAVDLEYSMGIDHRKIRGAGGKSLPHAKMLSEFYNLHPEVFEQVKYINDGGNRARELNASDVENLPCGYLGVFKPGKGFENESGHAFVSDGFGGGFADEHDNGKWAHFGNGKGEHGQLEVYRLSGRVVPVFSEKLGRTVNVPLDINPWYLTPEFRELQIQERAKKGLPPLEVKEEFSV